MIVTKAQMGDYVSNTLISFLRAYGVIRYDHDIDADSLYERYTGAYYTQQIEQGLNIVLGTLIEVERTLEPANESLAYRLDLMTMFTSFRAQLTQWLANP